MSNVDVAERLAAMDDAYQGAEAKGTGGSSMPPDGTYQFKVERFDFFESKKSGNLTLVTKLVVIGGEHEGREAPTFHDLEDPDRIGWAKGHLSLLGIENVSPLSTLEQRLSEALDSIVEGQVKTKGEYTNVYVNKLLTQAGDSAGGFTPTSNASASDEDIPF